MADAQNPGGGDQQQPAVEVKQVEGAQAVTFNNDAEAEAQRQGDLNNEKAPPAQRPEGLPEGFDSWEAYAKDLEAKGKEPKDEGEQAGAELSAEQKAEVDANLEAFPEANREKARPFVEEVARTGDLSEEARAKAAEEFGVPKEWVDRYIAGAKQEAESSIAPVYEAVGGKEVFDSFKAWANTNYSAEQQDAFNAGLEKDAVKTVADAVKAWKEAGHGPAPRDITRAAAPAGGPAEEVAPYASLAEMSRDMSNPLYSRDEAFRKKVEARVAKSDLSTARSV